MLTRTALTRYLLDQQARKSYGRTKAQLLLLANYKRKSSRISIQAAGDGSIEVCAFGPDGSVAWEFQAGDVPVLADHLAGRDGRP